MTILEYIHTSWSTLSYSLKDLAEAVIDPKFPPTTPGRYPVYVSKLENIEAIRDTVLAQTGPELLNTIVFRKLPERVQSITEHGLLYLPHPYVVPGGRFREMYGWDSYFIVIGLLQDGCTDLAKNMVDNHLYQVQHYGMVLNANRTYYLSRSQPPFLAKMVLAMYVQTQDNAWLEKALPIVEQYYQYWVTGQRKTPTGLSRFTDAQHTMAPEVLASERVDGEDYYTRAIKYYETHTESLSEYDTQRYYNARAHTLTRAFYWGDRSMRATGFDPSWRFGAFNVEVTHMNPVCLNSLLYQMEQDIADMCDIVHKGLCASEWRVRAATRSALINHLLWNEEDGLYYDYNLTTRKQKKYPFLTTFYPLWAGLASPRQAARVRENLILFEKDGGLTASTHTSGCQWDAPYAWAPLMLMAVEGLRRYGYAEDANRISLKFLLLVHREYLRSGTLFEKYDAVGNSAIANIAYGYSENVTGFGWTNGVFLALYHALPLAQQHMLKLSHKKIPA